MITISEVQQLLLQNNPNGYYPTYMKYEEGYWEHIPGYITKLVNVSTCLDIGCGYGTLALFAKLNLNADLYCVDFRQYMSDELIKNYNIKYCINNIETEDFPWDMKYDLILFTEVFEHLNLFPIPTLLKIKNLLSDNGVIMFSTPSSEFWGKLNNYASWKDMPKKVDFIEDKHIYQFSKSELLEIFNICKLKVDRWELSNGFNNMKHFNIQLSKK